MALPKCAGCSHYHFESDKECTQVGCSCTPEMYFASDPANPEYRDFAYHQKILATMRDIEQKVRWMLEAVEGTRNLSNWEFITTCWKYFFGFRLNADYWSQELSDKIAKHGEPENIRRARQKVCHPELEQLRSFQEQLRELEKNKMQNSAQYWDLTEQIKKFWMSAKYIPTDWQTLKQKKIKESAIFEYSIEELNTIC